MKFDNETFFSQKTLVKMILLQENKILRLKTFYLKSFGAKKFGPKKIVGPDKPQTPSIHFLVSIHS